MANPEHLNILEQGVKKWNIWRSKNHKIKPDLKGTALSESDLSKINFSVTDLSLANLSEANLIRADLSSTDLSGVDLSKADLSMADLSRATLAGANLSEANLFGAYLEYTDLSEANLTGAYLCRTKISGARLKHANLSGANLDLADLSEANLRRANLSFSELSQTNLKEANLSLSKFTRANLSEAILEGADLTRADLSEANLRGAKLCGANLSEANLEGAILEGSYMECSRLVGTTLVRANLSRCRIYGISAWDLQLDQTKQLDLIITQPGEAEVTVDNLQVAQFIYLLLNNENIRHVIDTITSKVVLILGRFTPERKAILDALKEELRKHNYSPVVFDFEKPASKTTGETVMTLARMAKFVIADLTDAKSILQELAHVVPTNTSVPIQPIILKSQQEPGMLDTFKPYPWFLKVVPYSSQKWLLHSLTKVIGPAEEKARELMQSQKT